MATQPCPPCGGPPIPAGVVPRWTVRTCPGGIALICDGRLVEHLGPLEWLRLAGEGTVLAWRSGLFLLDGFTGDELPGEVHAA
jgi:hypothetical protein